METNEVMIDIGKPEDEDLASKDAQAARFGKTNPTVNHRAQCRTFGQSRSRPRSNPVNFIGNL